MIYERMAYGVEFSIVRGSIASLYTLHVKLM